MLNELPETPPTSGADVPILPVRAIPFGASDRQQKARSPKKATLRLSPTKKSPRKMTSHRAKLPLLTEDIREEEDECELTSESSSLPASTSSNPFDHILAQSAQAAQSLSALTLSPERKSPAPVVAPALPLIHSPVFPSVPSVSTRSEIEGTSPIPSVPTSTTCPDPPSISGSPTTPISLSAAQARLKKNPYAPAVPSPLSRILRIADSPPHHGSPNDGEDGGSGDPIPAPHWTLANLIEDDEGDGDGHLVPVPLTTLAEELGIESDEHMQQRSPTKRINRPPSPRRRTAKDRTKSKFLGTQPHAAPVSLLRAREKENAIPTDEMGANFAVPREDGLKTAKLGASRISIGAKVVGGRPTTNPPSLANRGRAMRPFNGSATAGAPRSLRDRVGARYGQMATAVPRAD